MRRISSRYLLFNMVAIENNLRRGLNVLNKKWFVRKYILTSFAHPFSGIYNSLAEEQIF